MLQQILQSLVAGALQGLTEFLPISSSGHLLILHELLNFNFVDDLAFDVVLHLGTLLALALFFWRDVATYAAALLQPPSHQDENQRLAWYLVFATLPAAAAGYFFESIIETALRSTTIVALMLIGVGALLYAVDRYAPKIKAMNHLTLGGALFIGCAQALALIPGVSRSGITIIAGLSQKLNRAAAARFSFLLSMPIVLGAGLKKTIELFSSQTLELAQLQALGVGFLSSAIIGYLVIRYFLRFVERHSLAVFAYYRILLGILLLLIAP